MADSIRTRIIAAVDARLKTITTANGYKTNAGNGVYEWITTDLAISQLPAIAYKDPKDSAGDIVVMAGPVDSLREHILSTEITLITAGATARTQIRDLIDDLYRAVGTDPAWGSLALSTDLAGDDVEIDQEEDTVAKCTVQLNIVYRTKVWDQTSQ